MFELVMRIMSSTEELSSSAFIHVDSFWSHAVFPIPPATCQNMLARVLTWSQNTSLPFLTHIAGYWLPNVNILLFVYKAFKGFASSNITEIISPHFFIRSTVHSLCISFFHRDHVFGIAWSKLEILPQVWVNIEFWHQGSCHCESCSVAGSLLLQ